MVNWWGDPDSDNELGLGAVTGNSTHGMVILLPGNAPNSTTRHRRRRAQKAGSDDDIEKPVRSNI